MRVIGFHASNLHSSSILYLDNMFDLTAKSCLWACAQALLLCFAPSLHLALHKMGTRMHEVDDTRNNNDRLEVLDHTEVQVGIYLVFRLRTWVYMDYLRRIDHMIGNSGS